MILSVGLVRSVWDVAVRFGGEYKRLQSMPLRSSRRQPPVLPIQREGKETSHTNFSLMLCLAHFSLQPVHLTSPPLLGIDIFR